MEERLSVHGMSKDTIYKVGTDWQAMYYKGKDWL